jgi:hypothetical protein
VNKAVPVWVLLLCILLGALFTMVFGWSVKNTLAGNDPSGYLGRAAVAIASFPTTVKSVFTDIKVDTVGKDETIRVPRTRTDLTNFVTINAQHGLDVKGLVMRANMAELSTVPGWRILIGAFTIDGEVKNAALALSPELEITRIWLLTEDAIGNKKPRPPHRKFIHGFDIMDDGSVIFSFDGGISLQRFDMCGSRIWAVGAEFHHTVTLDDSQEFVWTLVNSSLAKIATANGEIIQLISMDDIIAANPTIDILEIRKQDESDLGGNSRNTHEKWLGDYFHLNDVDPLPAALSSLFDGFEEGDLLVSVRSLNLIFVVAPDTLKVKWWRTGATKRQHDPDWGRTGEITVLDNRMSRDYSRIVSIAPASYRTDVVFDGRRNNFYTRIRGKHQFTENGTLLITSSQEGRIFEVNPDGKVVLEIFNTKPGSDEFNYSFSQAIWLPAEKFSFLEGDESCAN